MYICTCACMSVVYTSVLWLCRGMHYTKHCRPAKKLDYIITLVTLGQCEEGRIRPVFECTKVSLDKCEDGRIRPVIMSTCTKVILDMAKSHNGHKGHFRPVSRGSH